MYLEKLEVQGFKSFANKNKLIFSGLVDGQKRGLTAIVGPNGSGKSNVADSIRWALGEQSLKTLRGKKSEDVIFSGSDKKNQLGLAEVSLYLNNAEAAKNKAAAPEAIEKASDLDQIISSCPEIVITRRLYRSGESEYLLNNNRVRLADIQMLLAKANFGQKTYSVIGQGMVENFLSSSAADRKDFFDEATGVKQFQIKRDAALNKLESSYENLQQVDMLLTEIKPRLKSLTRQVEKLERRGEIEKELAANQREYYGFLWQDINQKLTSDNNRLLAQEKIKLERDKKLAKLNEELNKIRTTDNFQALNDLQPRRQELENQKNQYLKQLTKLQAELEMQLEAQGQFDVSWLNNKQEELSAELANLNLEIGTLTTVGPDPEAEDGRKKIQAINEALERAEGARRQITKLEEAKNQFTKQISKLEAVLEANLEIQGQFDVSWLNNKQTELQAEARTINQEISNLKNKSTQLTKQALENKLSTVQQRLDHLNQELVTINQQLKTTEIAGGQTAAIGRLIDEFLAQLDLAKEENDLNQVKAIITRAKQDFQAKIKKFINRDGGDELPRIKAIQEEIIRLTEDRQSTTNELNEERLRLSTLGERLRLLEDKERQINREADDIQSKLAAAQVKFDAHKITEEKNELTKKITQLDREIATLAPSLQLTELNEQKQAINGQLQDLRLKIAAREERRRLLVTQAQQTAQEITDIKNKLAKSQAKFDAQEIEQEKLALQKKLAALDQDLQVLSDQQAELNRARDKEKAQMFDYQKNIQILQQEINLISTELNNIRIEAARQETKLEDLEATIRSDELSLADIQDYQPGTQVINLERLHQQLTNNKNQLEQIGGIDPEAAQEYQETKERYDFLSGQTADLNQAIKSLEEIIYELDLNIKNRFDAEFKVISEKFNEYFKILFNGGNAKISKLMASDLDNEEASSGPTGANSANLTANQPLGGLTPAETLIKNEADDKLKTIKFLRKHNAVGLAGIDVQATPPGKKIQAVTMLSGGERALTAIALICAIISANPSPFVVLDEVDAALDEANSERLAQILDDLSNRTQFIVITHNRACMRKANILYGVTMEADGVSKLLSVKLDELKNIK
jgi:chromosome segregation protein